MGLCYNSAIFKREKEKVKMTNEKIEPESMEGARALCRKVWDSYPEKRKAKTRLVKQSYKEYQKIATEKTTFFLKIQCGVQKPHLCGVNVEIVIVKVIQV